MLSRIADSLFWMARYLERTDGILRMLKINYITALDQYGQREYNWRPVLTMFTSLGGNDMEKLAQSSDDVLRYVLVGKENGNSLISIINRTRENARGVQDHITKELWEGINELYHMLNDAQIERSIRQGEQIMMLTRLINQYLLINGIEEVTMPREQGWNFMNLGKYIERGILTANMLDLKFSDISYDLNNSTDVLYWRNLLLSLSGYELYLKRYHGGLDGQNVADMGILNAQFPRSMAYCFFRIERIMQNLAADHVEADDLMKRQVGRMRAKVEFSDLDSISKMGLHSFLHDLRNDLYSFSNQLERNYFSIT
jgi:uncharacterized alpha-E superfamily protein